MSYAGTLCLSLMAAYGLTSLVLSFLVAGICFVGLKRARLKSGDWLALRLLPSAGAAFLTLTVVLPAFLVYEPHHEGEKVGPLLVTLVMFVLVLVGHAIFRGCRACAASAVLLRRCAPADRCRVASGYDVDVVDIPEPLVAAVGAWRPRTIVARGAAAVFSDEEFRQVIAHEAAHLSAHDNLKLLLFVVSPDALAWLPTGRGLTARWRAAAELEADETATGGDRQSRLALASALIKVARLSAGMNPRLPTLSMPIAFEDVEGRVRQLLAPWSPSTNTVCGEIVTICTLLVPLIVVPVYRLVQQSIEALVAFAR